MNSTDASASGHICNHFHEESCSLDILYTTHVELCQPTTIQPREATACVCVCRNVGQTYRKIAMAVHFAETAMTTMTTTSDSQARGGEHASKPQLTTNSKNTRTKTP